MIHWSWVKKYIDVEYHTNPWLLIYPHKTYPTSPRPGMSQQKKPLEPHVLSAQIDQFQEKSWGLPIFETAKKRMLPKMKASKTTTIQSNCQQNQWNKKAADKLQMNTQTFCILKSKNRPLFFHIRKNLPSLTKHLKNTHPPPNQPRTPGSEGTDRPYWARKELKSQRGRWWPSPNLEEAGAVGFLMWFLKETVGWLVGGLVGFHGYKENKQIDKVWTSYISWDL